MQVENAKQQMYGLIQSAIIQFIGKESPSHTIYWERITKSATLVQVEKVFSIFYIFFADTRHERQESEWHYSSSPFS